MKNLEFGWKELAIGILLIITSSLTIYLYNQDKDSQVEDVNESIYLGFDKDGLMFNIDDNNFNEIIKSIDEINSGESLLAKARLESLLEENSSEVERKNFSKKEAVESLKTILKDVENDIEGEERSLKDRIELLDSEDTDIQDVLSEETTNSLYLSKEFEESKFNRQFTASSILIFHDLVDKNTEDDSFTPMIDSYDELVYLDSRFLTAHIPLDLFIGSSTGIAFEMQYIDGEWKLNPYTSMMSLNLMGLLSSKEIQ